MASRLGKVKKDLDDQLKKMTWSQVKRSAQFENDYSKGLKLPIYERDNIYNPHVQHNQKVFLPGEEGVNDYRGKLLSAVWAQTWSNSYAGEFLGLNEIERAMIVGKIFGFKFKDISVAAKITTKEARTLFMSGMCKIIKHSRSRCRTCRFRARLDRCTVWKVIIKKNHFCWAHRPIKKRIKV